MDVIMLSRIQFAVTVFFHFIFVPLTLGLSMLLVYMETRYVISGDEQYKRMTQFWGRLFLINFVLGIVTGITLEFQFGTNWAQYAVFMGNVFGPLLAIEATLAFFLESTFIAIWHFGWNRLSKKMHLFCIYMVAFAGNLSALWIIVANGFMQNPVGYAIEEGRVVLDGFSGFLTLISNEFAWSQYLHVLLACWLLGGFFVLGISAWHLLRKNETDFFGRSFKIAAVFSLAMTVLLLGQGHHHGAMVARLQPTKLAAMEAHWETGSGVPMYLLTLPDEANQRNYFEWLPIPGALSFLAHGDFSAEVIGLKESAAKDFAAFVATTGYDPEKPVVTQPDGTQILAPLTAETAMPPVMLTFLSFRTMVALGGLFLLVSGLAFYYRNDPIQKPLFAKALPFCIPLPYLCIMVGWMLAEVGRQPWIVNRVMTTAQGVSPVPDANVAISLGAFIVVYSVLGTVAIYLLCRYARRGPDAVH